MVVVPWAVQVSEPLGAAEAAAQIAANADAGGPFAAHGGVVRPKGH
jgi:hypothetical protein